MDDTFEIEKYERFHYTDVHGLLGILGNNTLRLCSFRTMNDSQELYWSIHKKLDAFKSECKTQTDFDFLKEIQHSLDTQQVHVYMTCFSLEKDLLSQWRAYSDDGKGVSIGFNLAETPFYNQRPFFHPSGGTENSIGYFDVVYEDDLPQDTKEKFIELFREYSKNTADNPDAVKMYAQVIAFTLVQSSVSEKNPAFTEENECRLLNLTYQANTGEFFNTVSDIKFKASGGRLTSYFDYVFQPKIVTEIMLGPKSEIDENELVLFLQKHGYEGVRVSRSSASYR